MQGHHGVHLASWRYDEYGSIIEPLIFIIAAGLLKVAFHHLPNLIESLKHSDPINCCQFIKLYKKFARLLWKTCPQRNGRQMSPRWLLLRRRVQMLTGEAGAGVGMASTGLYICICVCICICICICICTFICVCICIFTWTRICTCFWTCKGWCWDGLSGLYLHFLYLYLFLGR